METIHNKYRTLINKANSGYISGYTQADIMEILRWVETKIGHNIPINTSCPVCMIDLVKLFSNLEEKENGTK